MKETERSAIHKMEEELTIMEARLQTHYSQMGKSMLELAGSEQRAVNRLVDEIIKKKKTLSEARQEKQCPDCMVYNGSDSRFCRQCGKRLPEIDEKETNHGTE